MANSAVEALKHEKKGTPLEDALDPGKRIAVVMERSIGDLFMISSLFKNIKETYPDHDIYMFTNPVFFEMFYGNPYVHKILPYHPEFENVFVCE